MNVYKLDSVIYLYLIYHKRLCEGFIVSYLFVSFLRKSITDGAQQNNNNNNENNKMSNTTSTVVRLKTQI